MVKKIVYMLMLTNSVMAQLTIQDVISMDHDEIQNYESTDARGGTVLHQLAYNGAFDYMRNLSDVQELIDKLQNEGFIVLHLNKWGGDLSTPWQIKNEFINQLNNENKPFLDYIYEYIDAEDDPDEYDNPGAMITSSIFMEFHENHARTSDELNKIKNPNILEFVD